MKQTYLNILFRRHCWRPIQFIIARYESPLIDVFANILTKFNVTKDERFMQQMHFRRMTTSSSIKYKYNKKNIMHKI